jgi:hypothetical protein
MAGLACIVINAILGTFIGASRVSGQRLMMVQQKRRRGQLQRTDVLFVTCVMLDQIILKMIAGRQLAFMCRTCPVCIRGAFEQMYI